ncbi:MAG: ankyrin repeat domain-containing protein [Thermodesulfobacteriota bacterium]
MKGKIIVCVCGVLTFFLVMGFLPWPATGAETANGGESIRIPWPPLATDLPLWDDERLPVAAQKGDIANLKALLDKGRDSNDMDRMGRLALVEAAARGQVGAVEPVLRRGAHIEARDVNGLTALMAAAENGELSAVELLVSKGANVNFQCDDGPTALKEAVDNQRTDVVKFLLDHGANVNAKLRGGTTTLMRAALTGNVEVVKLLLEKGADLHTQTPNGATALTLAALKDRAEVVKLLRSRGAQLDLHTAALIGDETEAKRLFDTGADVNAADAQGWTSLMNAAQKGHAGVVSLLLKRGANPVVKREDGGTVLTDAVSSGSADVLRVLLDGAPALAINLAKKGGASPLAFAVICDRPAMVSMLLDAGMDVNAKGVNGERAVILAIWECNLEMVKLLLSRGADVQAKDLGKYAPKPGADCPNWVQIRDLIKAQEAGRGTRKSE